MAEYSDGASLDGLQQVVDRLASRLGRSAAVDDTQGRLVVASQHFGDQDPLRVYAIITRTSDPRVMEHFRTHGIYDWTEPGRIPYNPEIEFKARVCLPIREQGILFGHLFLIDEDVADWEIDEAAEAVQHIGQLMYGRLVVREEAVRTSETLVQDLVSTDPMARTVAMKQLTDDRLVIAAEPTLAVQLRLIAAEEPARLELALRAAVEVATRTRFRETYLAWVRGGDALILLFGRAAAEEHGRAVAEAVIDALAETPRVDRVVAGIGSIASGPGGCAESHQDAVLAARAATLMETLGDIVGPAELGVYRTLLRLPEDQLDEGLYPPGLRALLAVDGKDSLVETLETYLDCGGDTARAAEALHIHRSTLYYRIGRIESIAGVDLRDGEQRLSLHLGLRLRRMLTALPSV